MPSDLGNWFLGLKIEWISYSSGLKWWFVKMCWSFTWSNYQSLQLDCHCICKYVTVQTILVFWPGEDQSLLKEREYYQAIQLWQDFHKEYACSKSCKWYWILCANLTVIFKSSIKTASSANEMFRTWLSPSALGLLP